MGEPEGSRKEDRRSVMTALGTVAVVFAVAVLLGLIGLAAAGGGETTHSPDDGGHQEEGDSSEEVTVPDVVGMEVHQAGSILEAEGLEMTSPEGLEGVVTSQYPEPGHQVEKHSEVAVEVGLEPPHQEPQVEDESVHPVDEGHEADDEAGQDSH